MRSVHGYLAGGRSCKKSPRAGEISEFPAERTRTHTEKHERASLVPLVQRITACLCRVG